MTHDVQVLLQRSSQSLHALLPGLRDTDILGQLGEHLVNTSTRQVDRIRGGRHDGTEVFLESLRLFAELPRSLAH